MKNRAYYRRQVVGSPSGWLHPQSPLGLLIRRLEPPDLAFHQDLLSDPNINNSDKYYILLDSSTTIIPPNSFALARTVEYFRIPRNVLTLCVGKSTYARCGIIVNVTPLEPEWHGHVTLEFSNTTSLPAKIYAYEGVAQMLFLESDEVCATSYADREGKYQGQQGVTLPIIA